MDDNIGERIKVIRNARFISQDDLAQRVGVSKSTVSRWESGSIENIGGSTLRKVAEALGTSLNVLLGISGPTIEELRANGIGVRMVKQPEPAPSVPTLDSIISQLQQLKETPQLSREDQALLDSFHALSPKQKNHLKRFLEALLDE